MHAPLVQPWPPVHACPQLPQLFGSFDVFTQPLGQEVSPDAQPHVPPLQTCPMALHEWPHDPQLPSFVGSTQEPTQLSVLPELGQPHVPLAHVPLVEHVLHAAPPTPQFVGLEATHWVPVAVQHPVHPLVVSQMQWPPEHRNPAPHEVPQAPQLALSVCVSVQAFPQRLWPVGHAQVPPEHF